jgi:hypothetical protein
MPDDEWKRAIQKGLAAVAWFYHCQHHNNFDSVMANIPERFTCPQYPCIMLDLEVFPEFID